MHNEAPDSEAQKPIAPVSQFSIVLLARIKSPNYQDAIFKLPVETIHNICTLVDDEDLRNLLLVKRAIASIASDLYPKRLGIRKDAGKSTITLDGVSYRALGAWKRSRLFANLKDGIQLYCTIDYNNRQLAEAQVHCLRTFLSTDFTTTPLSSIVITGVRHLPLADIANFIRLIDNIGCRNASIMSPYEFEERASGATASPCPATVSPCPPVKLSNLRRLELDTPHFTNEEWSAILRWLSSAKLTSFTVRGPLPFISLVRFMGRHPGIEELESYCRWAPSKRWARSTFGIPQRIIRMPKLEKLDGPPSHLKAILSSLSFVPKKLTLSFHSDHTQHYSEFVMEIMETVRLCDGMDSNLDITIHFRDSHFELQHYYTFNLSFMRTLGVNCPGAKSLYLFFPPLIERHVQVSPQSLNISNRDTYVHHRLSVISGSIYGMYCLICDSKPGFHSEIRLWPQTNIAWDGLHCLIGEPQRT